jgi:hypothetical protein
VVVSASENFHVPHLCTYAHAYTYTHTSRTVHTQQESSRRAAFTREEVTSTYNTETPEQQAERKAREAREAYRAKLRENKRKILAAQEKRPSLILRHDMVSKYGGV